MSRLTSFLRMAGALPAKHRRPRRVPADDHAGALPAKHRRPPRVPSDDHAGAILASLSTEKFASIRVRYDGAKGAKYLDLEKYVPFTVGLCRTLDLIDAPKRRILDIGCGTGLFMYCAARFGHEAVGIDIPDPLQEEMAALFGVDRHIAPVRAFEPIAIDGPFDLVTAMGTVFDRDSSGNDSRPVWTCKEWAYLLEELERLLPPSGRVFLRINQGEEAKRAKVDYYNAEVHQALAHAHRGGINYLFSRTELSMAIANLARPAS